MKSGCLLFVACSVFFDINVADVVLKQSDSVAEVSIDIHVPVAGNSLQSAVAANKFLNAQLGSSGIDFQSVDTPHVTLYLTAFTCPAGASSTEDCIRKVATAINASLDMLRPPVSPCNISVTNAFAAGTYAMLNVSLDECLQKYSDAMVFATHQFSEPNQTAPDWVKNLPEPERSEKLALIREYGSPNVFSQFQPHVSVAWANDTAAIAAAVAALKTQETCFEADTIAMGSVGDHGTVLQHQDYATFTIPQ